MLKARGQKRHPAHISALPPSLPCMLSHTQSLLPWSSLLARGPTMLPDIRVHIQDPTKDKISSSTHKRKLSPTTGPQKDQSRVIIPSGSPKSTFSEYTGFLREATQCSQLAVSHRSTNEVQTRYPRPQENHVLTDSELVQTHLKSKERQTRPAERSLPPQSSH